MCAPCRAAQMGWQDRYGSGTVHLNSSKTLVVRMFVISVSIVSVEDKGDLSLA